MADLITHHAVPTGAVPLQWRMPSPLWTPSPDRVAATRLTAFIQAVAARFQIPITDYAALYEFSITRPEDFWRLMWEFGAVRGPGW